MAITSVNQILNAQGDLDDSLLLGKIVMFTITDERIERSDLEAEFTRLNLDKSLLPPEIKPVDAFKKATSEANDKYTLPNGDTVHVLCRDLASTGEYVKRQITREVKDRRARTLGYSRAIECTFYRARVARDPKTGASSTVKGSERVSLRVDPTNLDPTEVAQVNQIATDIQSRYNTYYRFLDGNRLRATVRDYLKHLNAIELKGGVYFIHVAYANELSRLQQLVGTFGGGCSMYAIPLVDIERERKMITAAYEREASQALQDITNEINALRASRKSISPAAYAKIRTRYDEIVKKANEHTSTLQISQDLTAASAEVALEALLQLQEDFLS